MIYSSLGEKELTEWRVKGKQFEEAQVALKNQAIQQAAQLPPDQQAQAIATLAKYRDLFIF